MHAQLKATPMLLSGRDAAGPIGAGCRPGVPQIPAAWRVGTLKFESGAPPVAVVELAERIARGSRFAAVRIARGRQFFVFGAGDGAGC
eukprot:gene10184-22900_t